MTTAINQRQLGFPGSQSLSGLWGSIVQLGLSLPDRGRSPQYVGTLNGVTAGVNFNIFTNTDPITLARRRMKTPFGIYFNAGKSGDTMGAVGAIATGMLQRFTNDVLSLNPLPGTVSFQGFGNDLNQINSTADIETVLAACKANFEAIYNLSRSAGMNFWIEVLPDNGTWSSRTERYCAQWRVYRYIMEFARLNNVPLLNYMVCSSWPDRQIPKTCTALSVASNVATATVTAHGFSVGDSVFNTSCDVGFLVITGATILTVADANTFTYAFTHANGSATVKGAFFRNNVLPNIMADGPANVHWAYAGAQKASYPAYDAIHDGIKDTLTVSEGDYENIVGAGLSSTDQNFVSRGMMMGTGGTNSGGGTVSGTLASGWDVNILQGSAGASVVGSIVAYSDPARSQMFFQRLVMTAGGADLHVQLRMAHTLPSAWSALASVTLGSSKVIPLAGGNLGYFFVCVRSGTTGAAEPTWVNTPGFQITDGSAIWECRRGWINDGLTKYRLGSEYVITANTSNAILNHAFGLFDPLASTNGIIDGDDTDNSFVPNIAVGENGYWDTPSENPFAVIPPAMVTPTVAWRWWIAAGKSATVDVSRASWYLTGLQI